MTKHILLREKEIPDIHKYDVYVENGGFKAFKSTLDMEPTEVIDTVKASNLRGRGGAGFPTGVKWSFIPQDEPVKYVAVNADESEPGTFKDRQIMENNPYQLIEGSMICAWAIQATAVYIYLRGEYWEMAEQLDRCIEKCREEGLIGKDIQGSGWDCEVYTHLGAGAYICGEESALLNSLEGKLGQPRVRPPFPAQKGGGLYAEPTVVNNVETLANVPFIINEGPEAFKPSAQKRAAEPRSSASAATSRTPATTSYRSARPSANCFSTTSAARVKGASSKHCSLAAHPAQSSPSRTNCWTPK